MSISPSNKIRDKRSSAQEQTHSTADQRKDAALDLAEFIYDIFVASESSDTMDQKG